jgi:hypothetical protein
MNNKIILLNKKTKDKQRLMNRKKSKDNIVKVLKQVKTELNFLNRLKEFLN